MLDLKSGAVRREGLTPFGATSVLTGCSAAWFSASVWGTEGPGFKSPLPDHFLSLGMLA